MVVRFEDLEVLRAAEQIADEIWHCVVDWKAFARKTVGEQLVRSADSIGANIAESYGRFHYGEKLQFLYYARGSLFETKYWVNRAQKRQLLDEDTAEQYAEMLSSMAHQLNTMAKMTKRNRTKKNNAKNIREESAAYTIYRDASFDQDAPDLFSEKELTFIKTIFGS